MNSNGQEATTSIPTTELGVIDVYATLSQGFQGMLGDTALGGVFGALSTAWSIYTIFAYVISLILLYIFIYASIRLSALQAHLKAGIDAQRQAYETMYGKKRSQSQFSGLQEMIESTNPNDWKLAIIEADILLDDALRNMGYDGTSLGERLKSISPHSLRTLDEAWAAHKVRNQIAHAGNDFVLTHKIVRDTMSRYRAVFQELGLIDG
jgi:uncharacterized membrane protein